MSAAVLPGSDQSGSGRTTWPAARGPHGTRNHCHHPCQISSQPLQDVPGHHCDGAAEEAAEVPDPGIFDYHPDPLPSDSSDRCDCCQCGGMVRSLCLMRLHTTGSKHLQTF